jgi:hypothetical protein
MFFSTVTAWEPEPNVTERFRTSIMVLVGAEVGVLARLLIG